MFHEPIHFNYGASNALFSTAFIWPFNLHAPLVIGMSGSCEAGGMQITLLEAYMSTWGRASLALYERNQRKKRRDITSPLTQTNSSQRAHYCFKTNTEQCIFNSEYINLTIFYRYIIYIYYLDIV